MTDLNTSDQDVTRAIRSWLHEDRHEDASRIAGAVLDRLETTPQRRSTWWPTRRTSPMNKILGFGLAAAAVVVVVLVGSQLFGTPGIGPGAEPTSTPEPSIAAPSPTPEPSPSIDAGLPVGSSYELSDEIPIHVTIPAPGWAEVDGWFSKTGEADPRDIAFVITGWVGDPFIPGDPCQWASTMPDTPATSIDEIVDALGRQATRDASEPVDVTADGYPGKSITLHVPEGPLADCDEGKFCTLSFVDGEECYMWFHAEGEIDELWIVDVDGEFIFTAGTHRSETPADVVEEVSAILASMTFGE